MLVEFTVKNYRSIRNEQTLSLVKGKGDELSETNVFSSHSSSKEMTLLRSTALYGPNAAGKSNIIRALSTMDSIVLGSASKMQEGDEINVEPFLFDDTSSLEPTEFEVIFISEGVRYQYGFAATKEYIIEEWLLAYPKGRAQRWFTRSYDEKNSNSVYEFGDFLTGNKNVWKNNTRNNALFLSTAVQLNSEQLKPIFNWFKNKLKITGVKGWNSSFTASLCDKDDQKYKILDFIKSADIDIHDIKLEKETFEPERLSDDIPISIKEKLIEDLKGKEFVDIKTIHKTPSGKSVALDLDDESDGTQKLFSFAGPWLDALDQGNILFIDELHDNLHPKVVKFLVDLFHNPRTNKNNAQLIFTTHETSILNQDVFRRDQIWFCEKDKTQATSLFPLTDFSPRKGRENIELGYLSGRYGALPFINELNNLEAR